MAYETVDCVVVGAGVVGLAVARALAMAGREVIVLEAQETIGTETSSRNSEIVHAGIYHPKGSNMARLCVQGRRMLYRYCDDRGVPYNKCGKLIVATTEPETETLARSKHAPRPMASRACASSTLPTRPRSSRSSVARARCYRPPPASSIAIASWWRCAADVEAAGTIIAFRSPMERGRVADGGLEIDVGGRGADYLARAPAW